MLSRIPGDYHGTVAFEVEIEGQKTKMSIDWATLEKQFECTIKGDSDAEAVFDGNSATINRAAEVAREDGCYKVELKHFNSLPDGYPVD
jgi:hypothetical protein